MTICTKCKHLLNLEPNSVRADVWYNHLCTASPFPRKVDPFDGKVKSCGGNDLGGEYFTNRQFQFCRNVNDGRCDKYEAMSKS